jgi:phosphohistidine phosphatase
VDLILWRHADAEEGADDMARRLTRKGEKQAAAMAKWLRAHLPREYTLLASPAVRAQQTAAALGSPIVTEKALAPGASPKDIRRAAEKREGLVIIVGHQPDLGRAAARLVADAAAEWPIEKGAIWWLSGDQPARIKAVVSPDLLL